MNTTISVAAPTLPGRVLKLFAALCAGALSAVSAHGAPNLYAGSDISIETLTSSDPWYAPIGGVVKDGDTLYFGNFRTIRSYDLTTGADSVYASIPGNNDTKGLGMLNGNLYIAYDTGGYPTYGSALSVVSPSGHTEVLTSGNGVDSYSIYDAVVHDGNYYFTANPGMGGSLQGTRIYRLDLDDPANPFLVADIGGLSGGLAFDGDGNLYYASQNSGEGILRFDAADVLAGGLSAADGFTVVNVAASNIGFLSSGELLAGIMDGQMLASYNIATGSRNDIAFTTDLEYMGKFVVDGDNIYLSSTDWSYDSDYVSSLYAITLPSAVPEPSSMLMLLSGLAFLGYFRPRSCKTNHTC